MQAMEQLKMKGCPKHLLVIRVGSLLEVRMSRTSIERSGCHEQAVRARKGVIIPRRNLQFASSQLMACLR
jgi:hypothetical protein